MLIETVSLARLKTGKGGRSRPHSSIDQRPEMMLEMTPLVMPISRKSWSARTQR